MLSPELQKILLQITIKSRRIAEQLAAGSQRTKFKSKGTSFAQVRRYDFSDDARSIHWGVTARLRQPYTKIFDEERERMVIVLVDVSASLGVGANLKLKKDIATEIAAIIGFSAVKNGDKLGALFFSDGIEWFLPPRKGEKQALQLIAKMLSIEPKSAQTNINIALEYLNSVFKKPCIVFLLSDFLVPNYDENLQKTAHKHELVGIRVHEKIEMELPSIGIAKITDVETGKTSYIDTENVRVRAAYTSKFLEREKFFLDTFKRINASTLSLAAHKNYLPDLLRFFRN